MDNPSNALSFLRASCYSRPSLPVRKHPTRASKTQVLEHPEIQDPDFEAVLHTLFKLAVRLPAKRRDELCAFFQGVEEKRFTRFVAQGMGRGFFRLLAQLQQACPGRERGRNDPFRVADFYEATDRVTRARSE